LTQKERSGREGSRTTTPRVTRLTPKRKTDLVLAGTQHGVEEEAAEGDLGAALVAEGVIDDEPDGRAGDEVGEEFEQHDAGEVIPVPDGSVEE